MSWQNVGGEKKEDSKLLLKELNEIMGWSSSEEDLSVPSKNDGKTKIETSPSDDSKGFTSSDLDEILRLSDCDENEQEFKPLEMILRLC